MDRITGTKALLRSTGKASSFLMFIVIEGEPSMYLVREGEPVQWMEDGAMETT